MSNIVKIYAREILDSRANPTVEAVCVLNTGQTSVSSVPCGASVGSHEVLELLDNDPKRYRGKGVLKAVDNVNKILGPMLVGMNPADQEVIDKKMIEMDGTENKSKLGANSILAVSEVITKAGAAAAGLPLYQYVKILAEKSGIKVSIHMPVPLFNMINGGRHGAGNLDFQEFFVIPASSKTFSKSLEIGDEIYIAIGENLDRRGAIHSIGDEGGYAPNLFTNADALEILLETIKESPYDLGLDVFLGLDVASSTFFKNGVYQIRDKSSALTEDALIDYYKTLNENYHLAVLEDPLNEDAWSGWHKLLGVLMNQTLLVGDDLLATNPKRIQKAIQEQACNAALIKPNQIGTVTETLNVIKLAKDANWKVIVSHRSGETNDWFIADFAIGVGADYVKFGAPARGERVAKYNRLTSIESELSFKK